MNLQGKTIVLMGRFHKLPQGTAKAGLEALGARVTASVSERTDLVFRAHDVEGRKVGKAATLGIPIYDAKALRAVLKGAAAPSARDESATGEAETFVDPSSLASAADPAALLDVLQAADWSTFVAKRDLPPLRARLLELERTHGVTEAHRIATDRIRGLDGTRLLHPYGHVTEIESSAVSPCGRYLATGSWVGDDYHRGGALQIWEVASGRCVNVLDRIEGGVGWPDHDDVIQWSADSTRVGLAYNTNQVGVFDPFDTHSTNTYPLASASVTDGGSRPPTWTLSPDGRRAYVSTGSPCSIKGCVVPLEAGDLYWLPGYAPQSHPYLLGGILPPELGGDDLWLDGVSWSQDSSKLYAYDAEHKRDLVIDLAAKEVTWAADEDEPEDAMEDRGSAIDGSDGVRFSVGANRVTFRRPDTGGTLSDFTFLREPAGPRVFEDDYMFENANFALDDDTWCAAFEEGVVIAPPDRRKDLEAVLAWSVDRRFAWPARWGGLEIVPDVRAAAELLGEDGIGFDVREYAESLEAARAAESAETQGDGAWPPPNTATMDDLFTAVKNSVSALGSNWNFAASPSLRHAARLRARLGEADGAMELVEVIPDADQRVAASADVAMILARAGQGEQARTAFVFAEAHAEVVVLETYDVARVTSSVAGAYHALGDAAAADLWFARAREAIKQESASWDNRLAVIWALVECGRVDEARLTWAPHGEDSKGPSGWTCEPWLLYLLSTDRIGLAEEFLDAWVPRGLDRPSSMIRALGELGRPDLLRSWLADSWYIGDERYERAQAIADGAPRQSLPPTPTEDEIAAMAEAHVELLKTPRAKREMPTEKLIERAADYGHLSAVLDLLGNLGAHDFNDRPKAALSALWRAATGYYVAPW